MGRRILFISNGHGEDNHSAHVIRRLRERAPDIEILALAIVGQGSAYRRLGVPLVGPMRDLPSGGFTYKRARLILGDIRGGIVGLTLGQIGALRRVAPRVDFVHATGDVVGQSFARISGRPYLSFISCLSALYEGRLPVEPLLRQALRSPRCRAVVTRDPATAEDLQRQGFAHARFGGIPSLDFLVPEGRDLGVPAEVPAVALLPGSRLPEARGNLALLMRVVAEAAALSGPPVGFVAALVPRLRAGLGDLAAQEGWRLEGDTLHGPGGARIACPEGAFADILHRATLVLGMAGLAVQRLARG